MLKEFKMKKVLASILPLLFYIPISYAQDGTVCQTPVIKIAGPRQVVFNYNQDRCNATDTFDTPAMAFKDANGTVHLFSGIAGSYMSVGSSLDTVRRDCSRPYSNYEPADNATAASFDNWKWYRSPWTEDGVTIYSLVHNEFHGWSMNPGANCPSNDQNACLFPSVTVAKSTDSGKTFNIVRDASGNVELGMVTPYAYTPDGGNLHKQLGVRAPTNIISRMVDGKKYYFLLAANRGGMAQKGGTCLYRSDDVSDPTHWRAWDGNGFNVVVNATAYRDANIDPRQHICTPVFKNDPSSWTYNTVLNQYIAVVGINEGGEGFGYVFSNDMIHWSEPQLLMQTTLKAYQASRRGSNVVGQTYPSIIDPQSAGLNFEYSGSNPYLYFTRFNPKAGNWHNRDLIRVPLQVSCGS